MDEVSSKSEIRFGFTYDLAELPMLLVTYSSHTFVRFPLIPFKGQTAYQLYRFLYKIWSKRQSIHQTTRS